MDDITYDDIPGENGQLQADEDEGATSVELDDQVAEENLNLSSDEVEVLLAEQGYQPLKKSQSQANQEIETVPAEPDDQAGAESQSQATEEVDTLPNEPEFHPLGKNQSQSSVEAETFQPDEEDQHVEGSQSQSSEGVETATMEPENPPMEGRQSDDEFDTLPSEQEDQRIEVSQSQSAQEAVLRGERNSLLIEVSPHPFTVEDDVQTAYEEVPVETNPRKIALILSGGGARGAFQVGAEKYAREAKGYQWDIIAGVSVGAMNGAMLAMHRYARLLQLWDTISDDQVYTGGFKLVSLIKILFGAKSFYGNEPLKKKMESEFEAGRVLDDLHVGAVSLISGDYVSFTRESMELSKAILASASIPVVWPPVDISPDYPAMVDGGVRNISPVGDVLELEPDEIVIINCSNERPPIASQASANVLSIGMRALDVMQNEIFINDMKQFLRINALVKEAEQQDAVLHHPKTGRLYKYYPCQVIEPDIELGDVLDFSQKSVQAALKVGVRRAREVLGRP